MRRIDLFCKLLAPVFISLIDSLSTRTAIWTVFGLNTASVGVEYLAIAQVRNAFVSIQLHLEFGILMLHFTLGLSISSCFGKVISIFFRGG